MNEELCKIFYQHLGLILSKSAKLNREAIEI